MFRILFLLWFIFHPVHVTLLSINYMPETSNYNGFIRIYLDDLLLDSDLSGFGISKDKLIAKERASVEMLERYLNEKVVIKVNEKHTPGSITKVSIDVERNEVDVNLLFVNGGKPGTITVKNLIMTNLYKDQANMVIVKADDFEEGVKLTSEITEQTFKID